MPEYVAGVLYPILSRYEIPLEPESILGSGGMGVVFKANDRLLDKKVAIKTINPSLVNLDTVQDDTSRRLFFREAMTHARLGIRFPEQILPVNNYGIEDHTPFMEIEMLEGGSLRDRISQAKLVKRRGPVFDVGTIKEITGRICPGLKILHENKVYHSDLKPGNILFVEKDTNALKIADLGIARVAQSGILTRAGIRTFHGGSMHYTPQAVVEGHQKATERTDLYSVGVMIFEMIVREPLLWSQARQEFVDQHPDLSRSAKDIIKKACQLLGRNNFKSADELQEKLETLELL
jgi:serine/threonine-protein kinase